MAGVDCGSDAETASAHDAVGLVMDCVAETGSKGDLVEGQCTPDGEGWYHGRWDIGNCRNPEFRNDGCVIR